MLLSFLENEEEGEGSSDTEGDPFDNNDMERLRIVAAEACPVGVVQTESFRNSVFGINREV
jgi:hypothetical protein